MRAFVLWLLFLSVFAFAEQGIPTDFVKKSGESFHGNFFGLEHGIITFTRSNSMGLSRKEQIPAMLFTSVILKKSLKLNLKATTFTLKQAKEHLGEDGANRATFFLDNGKIRKGEIFADRNDSITVIAKVKGMDRRMTLSKNRFVRIILANGKEYNLGKKFHKRKLKAVVKISKDSQGNALQDQTVDSLLSVIPLETEAVHLPDRLKEVTQFLTFDALRESGTDIQVGILPFEETAGETVGAGKLVADWIAFHLRNEEGVTLLDRTRYRKGMEKVVLSHKTGYDNRYLAEFGTAMNADWVVWGRLAESTTGTILTVGISRALDAQVLSAVKIKIPSGGLLSLQKTQFPVQITGGGAMLRSLVLPGWGQFYSDSPIRGSFYSLLIAGGIGYATWSLLDLKSHDDHLDAMEKNPTLKSGESVTELTSRYNSMLNTRNDVAKRTQIAWMAVGGVWAFQTFDALISGWMTRNKNLEHYFGSSRFAVMPIWTPSHSGLRFAWGF